MIGPFPASTRGYKYLIVVVDKFTKWVEAEPIRPQMALVAVKFITSIVCRIGVPKHIISDLGL